jgi:hypothetical protein
MKSIMRLGMSPIIIPAYTVYGAIVGTKNGTGLLRGAIAGWATGINYVLSGELLINDEE